jgi:phospholipase C
VTKKFYIILSYLFILVACTPYLKQASHPMQSYPPTQGADLPTTKFGTPVFGHIIVVVMENLDMTAAEKLPYFKGLMQQYAFTRNYTAITHPSLPNYLALISGETQGYAHSCVPGADCHIPGKGNNLADELETAGLTWKAYLEGMPEPCTTQDSGRYVVRHNPFVYFDSIRDDPARCKAHVVPFSQFQADLLAGILPNFAWITPDICNSMHTKCMFFGSRERQGEQWLATFIPAVLASKQFQSDGLLVITFDEGKGTAGCCGTPGGGKVLTLLISGTSAVEYGGWASDVAYNHYSLLRTIEDNWGLPYLGNSGNLDVISMSDFLNQKHSLRSWK